MRIKITHADSVQTTEESQKSRFVVYALQDPETNRWHIGFHVADFFHAECLLENEPSIDKAITQSVAELLRVAVEHASELTNILERL